MMASSTSSSIEHTMLAASEQLQVPSSITKFKIGLCQLSVTSEKNQNLACAHNSIKAAVKCGASLVVLPEMWNCPYSNDYFAKFAEDFENEDASPTFSMLSEAACSHGITIVGGSVPESSDGQLYNTSCVFGPDGKLKAKHRKIHLFDIEIPGDITFKESDFFAAGDKPTIVDTGAPIICYPGDFNISTGELLWEVMKRARAADNQLFVASCSPSRDSSGSYAIWGHSTLVGPSGEIIATSGHEETVVVAEIDYSKIELQR
ncbi:hypothetical protein CMV_012910 [Castanea mollissima]|uniref:CN hydrolase domain-containing protein n=1 Tax=Castanea mollissima TaxID=60419 RepID=A0A8J4RG02_9ROSI|nr:hypothetical protein CMV_012910 [Castanea mollissima]